MNSTTAHAHAHIHIVCVLIKKTFDLLVMVGLESAQTVAYCIDSVVSILLKPHALTLS